MYLYYFKTDAAVEFAWILIIMMAYNYFTLAYIILYILYRYIKVQLQW